MLEQKKIDHYKTQLRKIADRFKKKNQSNPPLCIVDDAIDKVFVHYYEYEKEMINCMDPAKTDNGLDRHKIAAAFFCAIIKAKPLAFNSVKSAALKGNLEIKKMANKECAFVFALQIIQDFFNQSSIDSISPDDKIIYANKIRLPKTHDKTYSQWFFKLITDRVTAHLDYKSKNFEEESMFFISNLFFMMESYSYQYYKAELFVSRNKKNP